MSKSVPLLFNIYLADLFLIKKDVNIANYADDTTPCALQNDIGSVIKKILKLTRQICLNGLHIMP